MQPIKRAWFDLDTCNQSHPNCMNGDRIGLGIKKTKDKGKMVNQVLISIKVKIN
jgi:hypothetical protein